ncbi:MAG: tetratricopeptide repeat protein [Deltaproteobacteria bacterium]|nr:tetratricopeptide repeat protein [Deltaproteobacteria bacterium]
MIQYFPEESDFLREAEAELSRGNPGPALCICRRGLAEHPGSLRGRLLLGRCLLEEGNGPAALAELEKVAGEMESLLPVFALLEEAYRREGQEKKALEARRKAVLFSGVANEDQGRSDFSAPPAKAPGGSEGDVPPEEEPGPAVIQTDTLAGIYIRQGRLERALAVYREILAREPDNQEAREKVRILEERLGRGLKSFPGPLPILKRWLEILERRHRAASA